MIGRYKGLKNVTLKCWFTTKRWFSGIGLEFFFTDTKSKTVRTLLHSLFKIYCN